MISNLTAFASLRRFRKALANVAFAAIVLMVGTRPGWAAANRLLIDDFEDVSDWMAARNISGEGRSELGLTDQAAVGQGALRVVDRCTERHAYWLVKRCPSGTWDLSRWQKLHVWIRGDGSRRTAYFKAVDETRKQMFWRLGRLPDRRWKRYVIDLARDASVFRHENPNLARIVHVGLRIAAHCAYDIGLDEMWLSDPTPPATRRSSVAAGGERVGYLRPRHVDEIEDSMVGVNLHPSVGDLTADDIDLLARAGVKWAARAPIQLQSSYHARIRQALLEHRFRLHGICGVSSLLTGEELARRLDSVRRTVTRFRDIVHYWEIGNEPNIAKFWSGKPDATEFGKMVIEFARAIRSADPSAKVISGGIVGYSLDFGKEMLETGMGEWVDYVGVHTPRSRPEDGGRGRTHAEALAQFRKLIRSYRPELEVWQTEVQATPNVEHADVKGGITDFQQARHIGRRYFVENSLGIPVSFWQLFKAGSLDHPGALLRADGTPTVKFYAIQNVAALVDKQLEPCPIQSAVEVHSAQGLMFASSRSEQIAGSGKYSGEPVRIRATENIDLFAEVTTDAQSIDARVIWLDEKGRTLESISSVAPIRPAGRKTTICRRYPAVFMPDQTRFAKVEVSTASGNPIVINSLRLIGHGPPGHPVSCAFRRKGTGALFVAYWLDPRPTKHLPKGMCALRMTCDASQFESPVLIDMIDGAARKLPPPEVRGREIVFKGLPITDYPMVMASKGSVSTQRQSPLLREFKGHGDLLCQFIADRFGRGRPRLWELVQEATADRDDPLSRALSKARDLFADRLVPIEGDAKLRGLPTRTRPLAEPAWRQSIVNPKSQHADRFFVQIRLSDPALDRVRVLADGEPCTQRKWADSLANVGTWFLTRHNGYVRVFVCVRNGEQVTRNVTIAHTHLACTPRVFCFREKNGDGAAAVYWGEPFGDSDVPRAKVTLVGSKEMLPAEAALLDLATGARLGSVRASGRGSTRELRGIPLGRWPVLAVSMGSKLDISLSARRAD